MQRSLGCVSALLQRSAARYARAAAQGGVFVCPLPLVPRPLPALRSVAATRAPPRVLPCAVPCTMPLQRGFGTTPHRASKPEDADPSRPPHVWLTIPNVLTTVRIALSPVVAWQIMQGNYEMAAYTLAGAGALDFFDGWIARRFKQTSMVGTFLDPFADKALLACTTVALGAQHIISPWLAGLIITRDVALIAGAVVLRFRTREAGEPFWSFSTVNFKIDPSLISKVNTAMQLGLMCTALTHAAWHFPSQTVLDATSLVTAGTTLWSGLDYLRLRGVTKVGKGKS